MILYLDASAIVKLYVVESGSDQVRQLTSKAEIVGTALISRAAISIAVAQLRKSTDYRNDEQSGGCTRLGTQVKGIRCSTSSKRIGLAGNHRRAGHAGNLRSATAQSW